MERTENRKKTWHTHKMKSAESPLGPTEPHLSIQPSNHPSTNPNQRQLGWRA